MKQTRYKLFATALILAIATLPITAVLHKADKIDRLGNPNAVVCDTTVTIERSVKDTSITWIDVTILDSHGRWILVDVDILYSEGFNNVLVKCIYSDERNDIQTFVADTFMVSEIIDVGEIKLDYSKMPSYCKPETYKILKTPSGYIVQLIRGTLVGGYYNTPEKAQKDIHQRAARSKQRWIESGGVDF